MRRITKVKREIRAISPVIATLLMIAIAVVASLVAYAWVMGYIGGTTSTAGKAMQIQSFASQGGKLVVYVQNVGQGTLELKNGESVYVNDNLVTITDPTTATIQIPVGQTVGLLTSFDYTAGQKVHIKVTAVGGTFMEATGTGGTSSNNQPGLADPVVPVAILVPVSPITLGAHVAASVTVTGSAGTPSGTVTFWVSTDSGVNWAILGVVKTLNGAGSATSDDYLPAAAGTGYQFRAQYSGDGNYNGATGSAASLTVNSPAKVNPVVSVPILVPVSPITLGAHVAASVTVTGSAGTPSGTVTFWVSTDSGVNWAILGVVKTLNGAGSATSDDYLPAAAGTGYLFHAQYNGDANYNGANSNDASLTVNSPAKVNPNVPAPTLNPSGSVNVNTQVALSVTISGSAGTPTGTALFQVKIGAGAWTDVGSAVALVSGAASTIYTPSTVDSYQFQVVYSGDSAYNGATGSAASLTATSPAKADPTVPAPTLNPLSPITLGASVTVSVTVTGSAGTPTGTVDFQVSTDGGTTFTKFGATKTLVSGSALSDSYTPATASANYRFRVVYSGDTNYNGATGSAASLTVNKVTPSVPAPTLNPLSPITLGTSLTASVTVPTSAGTTPTGTVDFQVSTDGGTTFTKFGATKTLVSGSATSDSYAPATVSSNYRFRAVYSGDGNYNVATGSTASLTVKYPFGLDGKTSGTGTTSLTLTLSTTYTNDVLYVCVDTYNPGSTATVTSTGLAWTRRASVTTGSVRVETWSAIKASSGSTTINIAVTGNSYTAAVAFGVSGANTASPFDVTNPVTNSGTSASASTSITTTNANDFIIGAVGIDGTGTVSVGSGYTLILTQANTNREISTEYDTTNSVGSNTVNFSLTSNTWAIIADAIIQAP